MYGKRIAIVGGAEYDQAELEGFDLVARTNNHWERQGGQFDMLYHCGGYAPVLQPGVQYIAYPSWASKRRDVEREALHNDVRLLPYDETGKDPADWWFRNLWCRLRCFHPVGVPLTGFAGAAHLLSQPIKELYLTGMDLYVETIKDHGWGHNLTGHARILLDWLAWEKRLRVSDRLLQAAKAVAKREIPRA